MLAFESFAERALRAVPEAAGFRLRRYAPSPRPAALDLVALCREALRNPTGGEPLAALSRRATRIVVIVSDATRDEPRAEMLAALFEVLPRERTCLVVAAGTHRATDGIVPAEYRDLPLVVHDAARADACVDLGTTREGTRVRLQRVVAEADLVVVTGRTRPHYFAGYSGGVKGIFPGCAFQDDILKNHLLKADPTARLGRVEGNRCRDDMEEAALRVRGTVFALNVLCDCDAAPQTAVGGHPVSVQRALAKLARPLFVVRAPRARVVVVADEPPVSRSLYQACKLLPPAGAILEPGGCVILVAECDLGVEPLDRVNDGIYRLGVSRSLPERHQVLLVSALPEEMVRSTFAGYMPTLEAALHAAGVRPGDRHEGPPVPVIFRAGEAIVEAIP